MFVVTQVVDEDVYWCSLINFLCYARKVSQVQGLK